MQRITALDPTSGPEKSKDLFDAIQHKLGVVPNMMRTMGNSPAVLNGYLSFSSALDQSAIGARLNKLIALTVANLNQCEYCNSIHSYLATNLLKLDDQTIHLAKEGKSSDNKITAALTFVSILVEKRGHVDDVDINNLKLANYTEAEIAEIIAATALNIFTNYFNTALLVTLDFPRVKFAETVSVV